MSDVYAVSMMVKDEDGQPDLLTYAVVAENDEEAVGYVMLNEDPAQHGAVVLVNTDKARREDAEECYKLTALKQQIAGIANRFYPGDDDPQMSLDEMRAALESALKAVS